MERRRKTPTGLGLKGNIVAFGGGNFANQPGLALRDGNQVADNLAAKAPGGAERGAYQLTGRSSMSPDRVIWALVKRQSQVGNLFIVDVVEEVWTGYR